MSKSPRRQRLIVEALESRLLFSATADIALFDDGNSDADQLQQNALNVDLVEIYALTDDTLIPPESASNTETDPYLTDDALALTTDSTRVVVFVDTSVENYQLLVDDIRANYDETTLDIIFLDPTKNGVEQITEQLNLYTGLTAIHIISHGKNGSVDFANASLNANTIHLYEDDLVAWRSALSDDADILFYGCDIAATEAGQQLLDQIAALTQADIAASTNLTGHTSFQADWNLEFELGVIDTDEIISASAQEDWVHVLVDEDFIRISSGNLSQTFTSGSNVGQNFIVTSGDIQGGGATYVANQITIQLKKDADAAAQTITVQLRDSWNGTIRGSDTISSTDLTTDFRWLNFDFANVTLDAGQQYVVQITTTGADGKVSVAYNGSDVWNNTSMVINGTGDVNKDLAFYITNEDGINALPTVANAIPDQSAIENIALNFQFTADTFNDTDLGQNLTYTATLSNDDPLPAWLSFNAATRTFSGTPDSGDVGVIAVKVTANDGNGGTISDTFNITTAKINDAPSGTDATLTVLEDGSHIFTAANFGFDDSVDNPDADELSAVIITTLPINGTLTLDGVAVIAGASISVADINAGDLVFTPVGNANGVAYTSFTFQVQDDGGTANGGVNLDPTPNTITFDVTATNDDPTVANPILNQAATEDAAFNFQFANNTFNDIDVGDTFTYTAQLSGGGALPAWLSFDAITRTFSGTPANGDVGTVSIDVIADDGNGGTITDTFDIAIANTNDVPTVANPIVDQAATEDTAFNFQFANNTFADVDVGDTLTYTAQLSGGGALPAWLSFDANTRTFSGTPANGDVGTVSIDVIADDGNGGTVSDTFDIVVANTNDAPTVANPIVDQAATEDAAFNFQFANNTFADVDVGDTLTYTAQLAGGGALPAWLSFDANTRTFSGTPLNADVGTIAVEVIADDGNGSTVADTFDIVIANVNDAPTVANPILNQAATEDAAFNFQFANNTFNDVDVGDTLTYTAQLSGGGALPAWLSFDANTRTFSGTPANGDVGSVSIDVTADDGNGGTVSDTFDIVVANTNDTPTVANPIVDQAATEDAAFNFQFANNTFADVDVGDTLTYTAQLSGGGALPAWLSFDANTRTFSGTPANDDVGTVSIDVIADDGNGGTVSDTFDIVVANTNDTPTVANPIVNQAATEDAAFNFQFANNTFADVDVGDTLTYTAQLSGGGALPAWLSFDANTRTFSGTPANGDVGTVSIDVIADDGNGGTVSDTFDIVVANTNDTPTVANPIVNQAATEDAAFNFQFANNTFADVDVGDTLTYTAQLSGGGALPAWLSFDANTRTFSGTPLNADVGTIAIDVIANDGNGGTVTDTFDIVIANTNDAPTVANPIVDQAATEDTAFSFQFANNTFNDVDVGDTLTYTAQLSGGGALPAWLSFDAVTRTFSGTPANGDVGTVSIDVIADDGNGGTVSDTFDIVVANTNDAPTVANPIVDQAATEDAAFNFQFANNTFADVDVGDTLTYTAQLAGGGVLPAWLSFDANTRTFSGTPANDDVGTVSIDVIADDGNGGTVADTFDIVIANANDAPTVTNPIPNQAATEDAAFNFQFANNTFADVDVGDTLTYTAQLSGGGALPTWLSFDANTRAFSGTPANGDVGTVSIDVIADDGNGGTITDTFDIAIANTNDAPTVANPIVDQAATEDTAFNFQFANNTFNDVDVGDTLTYTAQLSGGGALPTWLSFDANTRTFSGTPLNADVGTIAIDVIANDGNGGTVTDTFDIVIANTNDAPTVANPIVDQAATEDAAFSFQFANNTFNDVDVGDTLTYTAQLSGGGALPAWLSFDAVTRTFSGTPANGDVGTVSIDVIADDGNGGTVADTFDIVIANTNDAPTVANPIVDQAATEDAAFNFQFANNTFADADVGDTLTYTAQLSGGGALPAWLSFDANTRTFSGTPLNADVGTISVEVTANDGNGGVVTDTFDIVIANVNDAPTIANPISNQAVTEGSAFNFQFAPNTFNDVDIGDTLTYTAQLSGGGALPAWLSFDANTRIFSGTPLTTDAGTISIEVIANDGNGGVISHTFALVVNTLPTVPITPPIVIPPDIPEPIDPETKPPVPEIIDPIDDDEVLNPVNPPTPIDTDLAGDLAPSKPLLDIEEIAQADKNNRARLQQLDVEDARTRDILGLSTSPLLASLITPDFGFTVDETTSLDAELRKMRKEMDEIIEYEEQQKAVIAGVTISITTGLLVWSLRASSLLFTLISMLPLWRGIDPLPILEEVNKRKKELEQQRKDKQKEDKNAKEVGYLFDNARSQSTRKPPK